MNTLFLDIASNKASLALIKDGQTLIIRHLDHRISDADLIPLVEDVLKESAWTYKDLTHLACVTGPGGFTSLRVGVAFANTLASQLQIPMAGVHLSDLYAARVPSPGASRHPLPSAGEGTNVEDFLWLHSTKKHEIFIRGFGSLKNIAPEARCEKIEEIIPKIPEASLWTGELIDEHKQAIEPRGMKAIPLRSLEEALPSFLQALPYTHDLLVPWYGRMW
ncbi:tRNA (adenosine(37)-N6)-threonylcarbamoyltransferase complex dimerization subunit type 1 TsaB [Candidatus Peribacteria bacterium RIFCSPHIGHO2_02_FULL_52_16]|nr:MAG: tRNA (adenosine(37)-N6)-threonylcarbamoyltransferase complex dimerization subunit type 1 TsaB [Candidatus Peribacteria bacterium RIFCSPHIGHO2_01_FULL_51_35]OGJ61933.1 MAG: tRNA (adenosine(37)-N6)-threonylcarbamoyltransferase complex dimerization subunit type 1 TsaB [Candidatus Peribacteria bacterium RIFCSPHIGHO2_02_FULL_52_16]